LRYKVFCPVRRLGLALVCSGAEPDVSPVGSNTRVPPRRRWLMSRKRMGTVTFEVTLVP